jgi:hypothetical protein
VKDHLTCVHPLSHEAAQDTLQPQRFWGVGALFTPRWHQLATGDGTSSQRVMAPARNGRWYQLAKGIHKGTPSRVSRAAQQHHECVCCGAVDSQLSNMCARRCEPFRFVSPRASPSHSREGQRSKPTAETIDRVGTGSHSNTWTQHVDPTRGPRLARAGVS